MSFVTALIVAASLMSDASLSVQDRPDFSGVWQLDEGKTLTTGGPIQVGGRGAGAISEPRRLKHVFPVYPPGAQTSRLAGGLFIQAVVTTQGDVANLRLLNSVPAFNRAALDAVSRWKYEPTLVDSVPVPVLLTVTVSFSLEESKPAPAVSAAQLAKMYLDVTIRQKATSLTATRDTPLGVETVTYDLTGRPSTIRTPERTEGKDTVRVYQSRWDVAKLITTITGPGLAGPKTVSTETRWIEGDTMIVEQVTANVRGDQPMTVRQVYRKI